MVTASRKSRRSARAWATDQVAKEADIGGTEIKIFAQRIGVNEVN
jgi:hypothetical protein